MHDAAFFPLAFEDERADLMMIISRSAISIGFNTKGRSSGSGKTASPAVGRWTAKMKSMA